MRALALGLLLVQLAATVPVRAQETLLAWVDVVARSASARGPRSWIDGGVGRLAWSGDDRGGRRWSALGEGQLGLTWQPAEGFSAHLHARARAPSAAATEAAGLVEAWLQGSRPLRGGADRMRVRLGELFLPTSRENIGPLWSSPYTLTLSAINSWIGEEVRPLGVLVEYETDVAGEQGIRAGASLFGGNDASGSLLAWRGWSMGDRLTGLGETLPLPPLPSLARPGGLFSEQNRNGTRPVGADLDGRPGWAGWLRLRHDGLGLVQATRYDNRGDRRLHGGEYAWDTHFDLVAAELRPAANWTLAAEHLQGRTAMGLPVPRADASFHATYALLSWERLPWRLTLRWDGFATADRDHNPAGEVSDEHGRAWTAAAVWRAGERLWLTAELVELAAARPALRGPGKRADGGRAVSVGLRYRCGDAG